LARALVARHGVCQDKFEEQEILEELVKKGNQRLDDDLSSSDEEEENEFYTDEQLN